MIFNVHAGHNPAGMIACGAVGLIDESTENRRVKDEIIRQLKALGHTVYDCTVNNGSSQGDVLKKIVEKCNAHKADLDISIHFNAGANDKNGNGRTTGTEVFVHSASSKAKEYADKVCREISALGYRNRGVKYSTTLYVLKNTKAPSMLVECCFVDDKDDINIYDYKKMASAVVRGIVGKNPEPVKTEAAEVKPQDKVPGVSASASKTLYRVQVGAYAEKANAEAMKDRLKKSGFDAVIVQV